MSKEMGGLNEDDIEALDNEQIPEKLPQKGFRKSAEKFLLTFSKQKKLPNMETLTPDLPDWDKCKKEEQEQWKMWYRTPFSESDSLIIKDHLENILQYYGSSGGWKNYLKDKNVEEFSISWEKHQPWKKWKDEATGELKNTFTRDRPYHIHAFIEFKATRNVTSSNYFDLPSTLLGAGSNTHANIRSANKGPWDHFRLVKYTQKDGLFISNIKGLEPPGQKESGEKRAYGDALEICRDHSKPQRQRLEESTELIRKADPVRYVLQKEKIVTNLRSEIGAVDRGDFDETKFTLDPIPRDILYGNKEKRIRAKSVLLWGPPKFGKTQYALSHFKNPIIVKKNRKGAEALDKINPLTDGIVFDDIDFFYHDRQEKEPYTADEIKTLLEVEGESGADGRYHGRVIPAGMPKIFCSNKPNIFFEFEDKLDQEAVEDRLHRIHIDRDIREPDVAKQNEIFVTGDGVPVHQARKVTKRWKRFIQSNLLGKSLLQDQKNVYKTLAEDHTVKHVCSDAGKALAECRKVKEAAKKYNEDPSGYESV